MGSGAESRAFWVDYLPESLPFTSLRMGLGLKKVHREREKKKTMSEKVQKAKDAGMAEGAGMLKEEREFM